MIITETDIRVSLHNLEEGECTDHNIKVISEVLSSPEFLQAATENSIRRNLNGYE